MVSNRIYLAPEGHYQKSTQVYKKIKKHVQQFGLSHFDDNVYHLFMHGSVGCLILMIMFFS